MIKFLGLDFIPLKIDHQEKFEEFLQKYPQKLSEYTFASLLAWNAVYSYSWTCLGEDTLLISTHVGIPKQRHLLQPIGNLSIDDQQALLKAISLSDYPIKILGVSDQFIEQFHEFCSNFEVQQERNMANYIYRVDDLANLAGRRYERKRNLISQAEKLYQWSLQPLTEKCRPHCPKILADLAAKKQSEITVDLENELKALDVILSNFTQLNQKGYMIIIDGNPAAFSIYDKLNPNTTVVHFEKAEKKYKGLYQLINRETAKGIRKEGDEFINREEDLGIEGLRKAKMSYFPVELVPFYILTWKQE